MNRGGSRGKKKPSLSDLSKQRLAANELEGWMEEFNGGSDRACALVASSYLDHTLAYLIETKFIDLSEEDKENLFHKPNAALSNFNNRIELAHALGLIPNSTRDQFNRVRRIRNAFAHSPRKIDFSHPLVDIECRGFAEPGIDTSEVIGRALFVNAAVNLLLGMLAQISAHLDSKRAGTLADAILDYAAKQPPSPETHE